jgi:predicted alpha/beta-fold hydrolase
MSLAGLIPADFRPARPWWGGDLQTVRNYAININRALPTHAMERLEVPLEDGSGDRLVGALHLPKQGTGDRPLVTLIHGIAGCENSCYMVLAAAFFLTRGFPVLRVNQRGAGPSRSVCKHQYHAGQTDDFATLIDRLDPGLTSNGILPLGFSLGGNMLLKYLGEVGRNTPVLRAATVSAPLDLALSCRTLMRWRNLGYHRYIMTHLRRNCTAPGADLTDKERHDIIAARSLWQFDDCFTAPRSGYGGADDYYAANSSRAFLGGVRVPTMLIHAQDDPFVPVAPYLDTDWRRHRKLTPVLPRSGGHLGFHEPAGIWYLPRIQRFFDER